MLFQEALASGADLSKNDKENLLNFLNGKNQVFYHLSTSSIYSNYNNCSQ
jgi:hypothetical protein